MTQSVLNTFSKSQYVNLTVSITDKGFITATHFASKTKIGNWSKHTIVRQDQITKSTSWKHRRKYFNTLTVCINGSKIKK